MNCRRFEGQAADWLGGRRLPPAQAEAMAAHRAACPACARMAATEAQIRSIEQANKACPPVADLWPRLAARLETPGPSVVRTGPRTQMHWASRRCWGSRRRWALAGACCLLVLGLFAGEPLSYHLTRTEQMPPQSTVPVLSSNARSNAAPREADAWVALREVPHSNPRVDDPVGANMEDVWTYLNAENK